MAAWKIHGNHIDVLIVRKVNREFSGEFTALFAWALDIAKARKQKALSVSRSDRDMTVGTDLRRRPLSRKELLTMTIEAGRVFGKLSHIGKSIRCFSHITPVLGRKLMARLAKKLFLNNVGAMKEVRVVDASLFFAPQCFSSLRGLPSLTTH
jgi:hypothetical protein